MTPTLVAIVLLSYVLIAFAAAAWRRVCAASRRRSKEDYQRLFEANPVPMWFFDESSRAIIDVNEAATSQLGYSRQEFLRMAVDELLAPPHGEFLQVLHPDPRADEMRLYRCRDGAVREMLTSQHAVSIAGRSAQLVQAQDITEYRRARRELAVMARELERSNKDLEEFAYAASHDLREPLRKMLNFAELLEDRGGGKLDDECRGYLDRIIQGADRLQRLIDDLLSYARVAHHQGVPAVAAAAPLGELFDAVVEDYRPFIAEAGGTVTRDEMPAVAADPVLVRQLLGNLLSNALKFRSKSSPRIHLGRGADGAEAVFSLADNGIGIDPEQRHRLFRLFQRLHARHEYPGTGLGLALCKKIVERHGGSIWVESMPGRGSTFYFSLPLAS